MQKTWLLLLSTLSLLIFGAMNVMADSPSEKSNHISKQVLTKSDFVANELSPYGAHSHIFWQNEWRHFPRNLDVMRSAGLGWMRSDFYWSLIEKKEGHWDYSQYDKIVEEAQMRNVQILGILGYNVPWAKPAYDHPEKWTEYVTRTVSRYKGRVRYWEVWNEENIKSFWTKDPNPEEYTRFLKITAEAVRKADPNAKILFGGTAGIPFAYIESCLKAGASQWFDILNIHPYRNIMNSHFSIQTFYDDIARLRKLLIQYKAEKHPVWITEFGWSDHQLGTSGYCRSFFDAVWKTLENGQAVKEIGLLHDFAKFSPSKLSNFEIFDKYIPKGSHLVPVKLDEVKQIDPARIPALIMPPKEIFPVSYFDSFYEYLRKGGTIVFTYGFPCYYNVLTPGVKNYPTGENSAQAFRVKFRMNINVWWINSDVPKTAENVFPDQKFANLFSSPNEKIKADLFLGTKLLQKGDYLVPILWGKKGNFSEPVAGIYRFNSDLKGNIAIYTLYDNQSWAYTSSEEIGNYLPQTYLIAFSAGVERFFTYQFQARETKPDETEDHFGLVHSDLSPKLGYIGLSALTKARPAGSIRLPDRKTPEGVLIYSWKRPDGYRGWALWNPEGAIRGSFRVNGKILESFDNLGKPITLNLLDWEITEKTLYLLGPEELEFLPVTSR